MKPTDSPSKLAPSPVQGAGTGFVVGVLGGLAAYYLTHSDSGQKLKHDLIDIWEHSRIGAGGASRLRPPRRLHNQRPGV